MEERDAHTIYVNNRAVSSTCHFTSGGRGVFPKNERYVPVGKVCVPMDEYLRDCKKKIKSSAEEGL